MGQDNLDEFGASIEGEARVRAYLEPQGAALRVIVASPAPRSASTCRGARLGATSRSGPHRRTRIARCSTVSAPRVTSRYTDLDDLLAAAPRPRSSARPRSATTACSSRPLADRGDRLRRGRLPDARAQGCRAARIPSCATTRSSTATSGSAGSPSDSFYALNGLDLARRPGRRLRLVMGVADGAARGRRPMAAAGSPRALGRGAVTRIVAGAARGRRLAVPPAGDAPDRRPGARGAVLRRRVGARRARRARASLDLYAGSGCGRARGALARRGARAPRRDATARRSRS